MTSVTDLTFPADTDDILRIFAKEHKENLKRLEVWNIRPKINLIKFEKNSINPKVYYNSHPQVRIYCNLLLFEDLKGLDTPHTGHLNISPKFFSRIAYAIKRQFGEDAPNIICMAIFRFDRFSKLDELQSTIKGKKKQGRIRYMLGIFEEWKFDELLALAKKKKSWGVFHEHLR